MVGCRVCLMKIIPLNIGTCWQLLIFWDTEMLLRANQVHEYNLLQGYQVLASIML